MTVVVLRPNSEDGIAAVTRVPNVSAWQNLDDSPADAATYVHGTTHGARLYLGLTTYTLAAGERVRYVTPRVQYFHNSADVGHVEYLDVRLRDSATGVGTKMWQPGTYVNTPGETVTGPQYPAGPSGVAWSQTILDRLQLDLGWRSIAGSDFVRVAEGYVDLDVNNRPVVSAVTVTGTTSSTRPAWTFTWTDADGDPQTRWRAKVFSATQYSAAGFDPETAASTWDSGAVAGNTTFGAVGTDLVNGVTYRVYVKAAQDWPGPDDGGIKLWWSAWVASSNFTMALVPPVTPTVVAAGQPGAPEYRVKLDVTAAVNLLSADDADVETTIGTWTSDVNCVVIRSTTNPANGVGGAQLTASSAATMSARTASGTSGYPVLGSTQYTAVAAFRAAVTGRSVNVKIRWYNRAGGTISTSSGSNVSDTTAGYTQATVTATSPSTAVFAAVVAEVITPANAEVHRVDMASLHRGATTTWTAGGMLASATLLVERAEKVANYRGPAVNWAHPQIASGGGLTRGVDGFYSRQTALLSSEPLDTAPVTSADGAGQARMVVWRPITGAFAFLDWGLDNNATTDPTPPYLAAAVVGVQTRMACWAKVKTGTFPTKLFAFTVDAGNTIVTSADTGAITLTTAWQRFTVDITPGAGSVYLRGGLENSTPTVEVDVCVTGIRICPTTADDGTTPPGQGIQGLWVEVRRIDAPTLESPGEVFTLYDHEPPPGRPVLYRVTTQGTVAAQAVASAPSPPVGVLMTPPARTVLKDPLQPENAMIVQAAAGDTWDRPEDSAVFHPLGRDGDPVTLRDWRAGHDASLVVHALSDTELYRLEQLIGSAGSLLIQWSEGGQTYARITGPTSTRIVRGRHRLTVPYRETARP